MDECPKCHALVLPGYDECPTCGVVMSKYLASLERRHSHGGGEPASLPGEGKHHAEVNGEALPPTPPAPSSTARMERFCTNCGEALTGHGLFCGVCGAAAGNLPHRPTTDQAPLSRREPALKAWHGWAIAVVSLVFLFQLPLLVVLVIVVGTSVWAAVDSEGIELHRYESGLAYRPVPLLLCCLLLWIVALPWYLVVRSRIKSGNARLKATAT